MPSARQARGGPKPDAVISYRLRRVYWPLIGGFIAFVLLALLIGWIVDPGRRENH